MLTQYSQAASEEAARPNVPPSPFPFLDYREFLGEFFRLKKEQRSGFSYRVFSVGCGFQSPNYLKLVMDGERNLTRAYARKVAKYCKLDSEETPYFLALVQWNQSKDPSEQDRLWKEVLEKRKVDDFARVSASHLSVVSCWQAIAILEMVRLKDFQADPLWIQNHFRAPISTTEIESALAALEQANLIVREKGQIRLVNKNPRTDDDLPSKCIRAYHRNVIEEGIKSLETVDIKEREFSSITLAIKQEDLGYLKEQIRIFRDRMLRALGDQNGADQIVQLNVQLFPVTKRSE